MGFQSSTEKIHLLPRYLAICNYGRGHMALVARTPSQELGLLRASE